MQARREVQALLGILLEDVPNKEENRCYETLYQCCVLLQKNQDEISRFQFDEEYDALVFMMAYIKEYYQRKCFSDYTSTQKPSKTPSQAAQSMQVPAGFMGFLPKLIEMKPEAVKENQGEIYQQVIGWGCYIQKREREKLSSQPVLSKFVPAIMNDYKQYETDKAAKRLEAYKWQMRAQKEMREKILKEIKLLRTYGSVLFFFIPLAYFITNVINLTRYSHKVSPRSMALYLTVCFFASLFPPLSSLINFIQANEMIPLLESAIANGHPSDPIHFQQPVEYKQDQNAGLSTFRKNFKKQMPICKESDAEYKSSTPMCVEKNQEEVVVGVYKDREKSRRAGFYRQQQREQNANGVAQFFDSRLASKRESKRIANGVMLKYQRAQEEEHRKAAQPLKKK